MSLSVNCFVFLLNYLTVIGLLSQITHYAYGEESS